MMNEGDNPPIGIVLCADKSDAVVKYTLPENNKENKKRRIIMSKAYDFLKECGVFFVLAMNGNYPAGRPFGAVMELENDLYIATNDMNEAHKQMRENSHIQIIAKKSDSREWIRITGIANECESIEMKARMIEECPVLHKHYESADAEHFLMFKVKVENVEMK